MELSELKKDGSIELNVNFSRQTLCVTSKVLMANDTFILVPRIVLNEQTVGFSDNCKVDLVTIEDSKPFMWENVVVKPVSYKGEIFHKIDAKSPGKPCNRRHAYRTHIGLEVPMRISGSNSEDIYLVLLKDLSENGCAFISDQDFSTNDQICIRMRDSEFSLELKAKIIRIEKKEEIQKSLFACQLIDIPLRLGQYLMQKQSQKRRLK